MDGTRFDEMTRLLARSVSRRTALKSVVAALLLHWRPGTVDASQQACAIFDNCAPDGSNRCIVLQDIDGACVCAFRPMAKSDLCSRDELCESDAECPAGQLCSTSWCSDGFGHCHSGCEGQDGVGKCVDGLVLCGSRCVDLTSDILNCGECGHQCGFGGDQPGEICDAGQCVCPPQYTGSCGQDYCTNEQMDFSNCGACGNRCESGQICCDGRCRSRGDAERFCDWCGYLGGWPQGCLDSEVCDHGICIAAGSEAATSNESEFGNPTGDLAYAVKNGDHWDIWVYSFDTRRNTQLTSEPNSDQWAPSYSHDGAQLAYLSDQADGSNQIWLMNPDGSNKRQITDWHGDESILYVAWSPDDTQLIVTLFGSDRRLTVMSTAGGELVPFVPPSSSFATTAPGGAMLYSSESGDGTTFFFGYFNDPSNFATFDFGDAPNISMDGHYGAVQQGDPGSRHIVTYGLVMDSPPLPVVPWIGDDSNPVWLTTANDSLAFVSSGPAGETIQTCQLTSGIANPIEIAPHDRVWYLSKRFGGELSVSPETTREAESVGTLPTLEPLPAAGDAANSPPSASGQTPVSNGQSVPQGTGNLEVHLSDCPPGFTGPDFYSVCHDNGIGQMEFILTTDTMHEEASAVIEQSPGPGIARFWNLPPGIYGLNLRTKFVKAPAYVLCSSDEGETVLVDQFLDDYHDPVLVPINDQAVVCDWNMLRP